MSEHGELIHARCRSGQLQLRAFEAVDRAQAAQERAGWRRQRTQIRRQVMRQQPCPLCHEPAMRIDWRPVLEWMTVEECRCRGFFVWTPLVDDGRLARLTREDRVTLSELIRALSATGDIWLSTQDGSVTGALNIGEERPDRPNWGCLPWGPSG